MYERIEKWYRQGLWTSAMVSAAAEKGVITKEQAVEILTDNGLEK